jgi:hypothetical protein
MGESQHVLGAQLGRLHAWRDRGAGYTEGFRTSGQFGIIGAGVAKGAGFTDTGWAVAIGLGLACGIEALKLVTGWLDYHFKVIHTQQRMVAEANPFIVRQTEALERMSPPMCLAHMKTHAAGACLVGEDR